MKIALFLKNEEVINMKMILTSKAFSNEIVDKKIKDNIGIDVSKAKLLFIPTALSGQYSYDKYFPGILNFRI